ncbi:eukaryotic translation initiation factor 3 subunit L-like protein [Labeo rohita]|nr:eukaryotic translation initiation factor 3 subunit L-like protein [Labeo rohita]
MPVAKLAGFLDMSEQEFRIQLLVFKHKMKNLVWTSGISALDGEFQSASEVDFYIDKVCVCVCVEFVFKLELPN